MQRSVAKNAPEVVNRPSIFQVCMACNLYICLYTLYKKFKHPNFVRLVPEILYEVEY